MSEKSSLHFAKPDYGYDELEAAVHHFLDRY